MVVGDYSNRIQFTTYQRVIDKIFENGLLLDSKEINNEFFLYDNF